MGWGGFLDKLMDKIPIQGRTERWKNELDKLEKEKSQLLVYKADLKNTRRMLIIERRIDDLNRLLRNKV